MVVSEPRHLYDLVKEINHLTKYKDIKGSTFEEEKPNSRWTREKGYVVDKKKPTKIVNRLDKNPISVYLYHVKRLSFCDKGRRTYRMEIASRHIRQLSDKESIAKISILEQAAGKTAMRACFLYNVPSGIDRQVLQFAVSYYLTKNIIYGEYNISTLPGLYDGTGIPYSKQVGKRQTSTV